MHKPSSLEIWIDGLLKYSSTTSRSAGCPQQEDIITNTQRQIHKNKYTNTNTRIQIHKYRLTKTNTDMLGASKSAATHNSVIMNSQKKGQNHITQTNHAISVWAVKRNNLYMLMKTAFIDKAFIFAFACQCLCISSCCFSSPLNSRLVWHCGAILKIVPRHSYTADSKMSKVQHSKTVLK